MNALRRANETNHENVFSKNTSLIHILNGVEEFTLDQDGYIIGSNLEVVNLTGYEEYEVIGRHLSIFYSPEDRLRASEDIDKACKLGQTVVYGLKVKKHGIVFLAKMEIRSIHTSPADSQAYRVLLRDATHRSLFREKFQLQMGESFSLLNNSFVGAFKFSLTDGSIQICNQKALDILELADSENLFIENLFSSLKQFEIFLSTLKCENALEGFKFRIASNNKTGQRWASISARCIEDGDFAEGILLDISEQHQQMEELVRVNSELDNFIYHASHDLRSPLTSVLGLLKLSMNNSSPEEIQKYLQMMLGRIEHMDVLLKDLLSISYNSGAEQKYTEFDFESELMSIVKLLANPGHIVNVKVDVHQQFEFKTDPVRVRTVLRNLVSNAFKYHNPSATNPFIHIDIHINSSHAAIQIKDNGIGIAPEYKSKVYDMFFRATEKSSGSGLGLYIVKSMMDKLDGRISFESTPNVGTTFLLTIPNRV